MNYISYRIALYKLNRALKKEYAIYSNKINKILSDPDTSKRDQKIYEAEVDYELAQDDIPILMTKYLISKTKNIVIPLPEKPNLYGGESENEYWKFSHANAEWCLTKKGLYEIRNLIRQERKEIREQIAFWIAIIFGIIGSLTGLLSVILKK